MNRIFSFAFFLCIWMISGINTLYAQKDTNAIKEKQAATRVVDSEKNVLLTRESEELQSIQTNRIGDSIRLLQLGKEIQQLGTVDNSKKKALTDERDQIIDRDSTRYQVLKLKIDSLRSIVTGFPVVLDQDTLFYVYAKLGSFTPSDRADAQSKRLLRLSKDYFFNADSLLISSSDLTTDIMYKENVIKSVSEMDAIWGNSTREDLALKQRKIIVSALVKYRAKHNWKVIAR